MSRLLIIIYLACLFTLSFSDNGSDIYPVPLKSSCAFPFHYQDKNYTDCTVDGDNGDIPWCSLTKDYQGLITYCYDFRNTTLKCLPSFTMPDGKTYTQCALLSTSAKYKQCKTNHPKVKYRYCTDALESSIIKSVQRNDNCDPAYAELATDHTMCYGPSPYATVVPLNATEKQGLLDIHNEYRRAVTSRYMFKLYWDNELAKLAQAHANLCAFEHDLAKNRVSPLYKWTNGQNIVMSSEIRATPASLFDMMFSSEKENFRYGDTCSPGENTCLHYTQAMLSNLTRVGCAQSHCVFPDRIERHITCNYIQSQYTDNYNIPYVPSDTSAVDCPKNQDNGLCDCQDKICQYDQNEYLEPSTCTCQKSVSKRSNNIDVNDSELLDPGNEILVVPSGKKNFRSIEKRHLKVKTFGRHKRGFPVKFNLDHPSKQHHKVHKRNIF